MQMDIQFYLGRLEQVEPILTAPASPLRLVSTHEFLASRPFYNLKSKNPVLDANFSLGRTDTPWHLDDPELIEAGQIMGFKPESILCYIGCHLRRDKVPAFREIADYLSAQEISHFMTAQDESGSEKLVRGHNTLTGTKLINTELLGDSQILAWR